MDFLSSIPAPMPPVEAGPDGTAPLPLGNTAEAIPTRSVFPQSAVETPPEEKQERTGAEPMNDKPNEDVFESDPFFNPPPDETSEAEIPPFESDDIPPEDVPVITQEPPPPPSEPATAEERLLDTIIGESANPVEAEETPGINPEELAALQSELDVCRAELTSTQDELQAAVEGQQQAVTARDRARQDLQILKTRFSTLESDLAATRDEAAKATQLRLQTEARHANDEQQWNDKLSHLRHMLDEVESIRDELTHKRVPKILFAGTLAAGILATVFAYFIGAAQRHESVPEAIPTPAAATVPPAIPEAPPAVLPVPPPAPTPPPVTEVTPPVVKAAPVKEKLPSLESERWTTSRSAHEVSVIFKSGLFAQGVELTASAKEDLKTLASAIKAHGNTMKIDVVGHTDSLQPRTGKSSHANNRALGLARAKAAAAFLIKQGGLSTSQVTPSSDGDANPPYPNTTEANRKKNRTVVLKIRTK